MAKPSVNGTVKLLVYIIDPEQKKGRYQRLELKSSEALGNWRHRVNKSSLQSQEETFTEDAIYTYVALEDGTTEMFKSMHIVADVGSRVRKLFCECGGHELFAEIEGRIGGTKTMCQKCQEAQMVDSDTDGDIDTYYDRLEAEGEY